MMTHHTHPQAEMDAPAWGVTDRLRDHLRDQNDITVRATDITALAAIHAGEHPVQAGIQRN